MDSYMSTSSSKVVQIGYVDEWKQCKSEITPHDTHIGGKPVYFTAPSTNGNGNSNTYIKRPLCTLCKKPLYLVVQLYAPTERDRSLLVYGCNNGTCYTDGNKFGTWKVFCRLVL